MMCEKERCVEQRRIYIRIFKGRTIAPILTNAIILVPVELRDRRLISSAKSIPPKPLPVKNIKKSRLHRLVPISIRKYTQKQALQILYYNIENANEMKSYVNETYIGRYIFKTRTSRRNCSGTHSVQAVSSSRPSARRSTSHLRE